ncbi:PPE family protein [Mycobacterium decipiens]|uniref:PPE family protein n=1 Tax=Mycobacterium decipiens TaxID=1430326 RepID=A0A1X2LPB3_9MYCO|nr:PPE family protein [Mycobacterium decipiens]OSC37211.1 hypothetical protein B8W66_21735 [Mycobacterium decipiens]
MHFAALPPETNSGRMYSGPGPGSMLAAAAAWGELADELHTAAASYASVISALTGGVWLGPASISMAAAATTHVAWLSATAAQAGQARAQANAAAAAHAAAFAMTVPPGKIAANRALLMSLTATNFLGQNSPAIAATEARYAEMWAQDVAAMYGYAAASAAAATLTPFPPPPATTNPAGLAGQAAAVAQAVGTAPTRAHIVISTGSRVITAVPQALQRLASITPAHLVHDVLEFAADMTVFAIVPSSILSSCMSAIGAMNGLAGSAGTAAKAMGSAGGALRSAAGVVGAAGLSARPAAMPAGLGRVASVGALSVPPSWAVAAPAQGPGAAALPGISLGGAPTVMGGGPGIPGMPMATSTGRDGGNPPPRYGFRPTVMARPVSAG